MAIFLVSLFSNSELTWKYDHLVGNKYLIKKNIHQGDF